MPAYGYQQPRPANTGQVRRHTYGFWEPFPSLPNPASQPATPQFKPKQPKQPAYKEPKPKLTQPPMGPAPAVQAAAPKTPAAAVPAFTYNFDADPVLNQVQALATMERDQATSQAGALKKQLAVQYGDAGFARGVLGDEQTAQAAEQNPFSVFAQLRGQRDRSVGDLDEALNTSNLLYSGHRIKEHGRLADAFGLAQHEAGQNLLGSIREIDERLMAAILAAQGRETSARQDAAARALQEALLYPAMTGEEEAVEPEMRLDIPDVIAGEDIMGPRVDLPAVIGGTYQAPTAGVGLPANGNIFNQLAAGGSAPARAPTRANAGLPANGNIFNQLASQLAGPSRQLQHVESPFAPLSSAISDYGQAHSFEAAPTTDPYAFDTSAAANEAYDPAEREQVEQIMWEQGYDPQMYDWREFRHLLG